MKQISILLLAPLSLFGQNFLAADKLALNTPPSKNASIPILAQYLCDEQPDDLHKIRAIYAWVTLNVSYVDSTDERDLWATPEHLERQRPERVLQNRTAVCQGYANLFCALATAVGIPCEVVTGLVKNLDGEVEQIGHAWAVAQINGKWQLFDPTWGVPPPGMSRFKVMNDYFMADPKWFLLRHLPDDPVWQLVDNPVTEREFRGYSDGEIMAFLEQDPAEVFDFQDTLQSWLSLSPASRMFAAENRVLRFNGSNERVVFGLGQTYWGMFFDLRNTLDSLTDEAILTDTLEIDTLWFEEKINLMRRYHDRARDLFARLETPERIEKAEKFYTPEDVNAQLEKTLGDMRTAVFGFMLQDVAEEVLNEKQLALLRYQRTLAHQRYAAAEAKLDCMKLDGICFEISHNRSLVDIQFAQRQVRFTQELTSGRNAAKDLPFIQRQLVEARSLYRQALMDCEEMRRRPPQFAFVDERIITAQQGLLTLRICEIRVEGTALSPEAEELLSPNKFSAKKAEKLMGKMIRIAQSIEALKDSMQVLAPVMGTDFTEIALFNLHLESFALHFNLANLRFRLALHDYETALQKNDYQNNKNAIRAVANSALQTAKQAYAALDYLEDSGRLSASSIQQKQLKINKLSKAVKEFLEGF